MFGRRFTLFRVFGFEVRLDLSWILLAVLITVAMAQQFGSDAELARLPGSAHWLMGAVGAVGLFGSIVFHELSHSLVARAQGIPMKGITLFLFGGVAEMDEEPKDAKAELLMAAVGPLSSLLLAGALFGVTLLGRGQAWPLTITGLTDLLAWLNVQLALFNLVPAFPLDGGRVLRALLWMWHGDVRRATGVASFLGSMFGLALVAFGLFQVVTGHPGGLWLILIGFFVRGAAQAPYQQLLARQALQGLPVRRLMVTDPVTVPRGMPVQELVDEYLYRHHFKAFPVVEDDRLLGVVSLDHVKQVPREEWGMRSVGEIAQPCGPENTIAPDADAARALETMTRGGTTRLLVTEGDRLVGILSLRDLLGYLSVRAELGG